MSMAFFSVRQGATTVYSAALFNVSSIRRTPITRRIDPIVTADLPDLPNLRDVVFGTENSAIPIDDNDATEIGQQDEAAEVIEPLENATAHEGEEGDNGNEAPEAAATSATAGAENPTSRQSGDGVMSLRPRPQASLRATARLRDRSQRRDKDRRSRSGGMRRNRAQQS